MISCSKYDICSAPLCPLDKNEGRVWYPNEEICTKHRHNWILTQRKLSKRAKSKDQYFTFEMLQRDCVIMTGITGISPDQENEREQIKKWMSKHKPRKKMSEKQRREVGERFSKYKSTGK